MICIQTVDIYVYDYVDFEISFTCFLLFIDLNSELDIFQTYLYIYYLICIFIYLLFFSLSKNFKFVVVCLLFCVLYTILLCDLPTNIY